VPGQRLKSGSGCCELAVDVRLLLALLLDIRSGFREGRTWTMLFFVRMVTCPVEPWLYSVEPLQTVFAQTGTFFSLALTNKNWTFVFVKSLPCFNFCFLLCHRSGSLGRVG
jgi:hypothetical protein